MELNSAILGSEIFLLTVDAQLSKDGTPLTLTGPTVTGTTFTYTTQLDPFERNDYGNYTCIATIRPQQTSSYLLGVDVLSDTLNIRPSINSIIINLILYIYIYVFIHLFWIVIPPPLNVRAIQSSFTAPVEVSWSPPTHQGAFNITGYRIFYGNGENISVPSIIITSVGLMVNENYDGQTVHLRSESDQVFSEHINVIVHVGRFSFEECLIHEFFLHIIWILFST